MSNIVFLDDDHVVKVARTLMQDPSASQEDHLRAFFAPEVVDVEASRALARGLLPRDGVRSGLAADVGLETASAIVFRRGRIDDKLLGASPSLRLVQRLGAGSDGIDLAAAARRGIQVSCLPRPTLMLAAEHTMALMLALAKRVVFADSAIRSDSSSTVAGNSGDIAYNWLGLDGIRSLYGLTLGIVGMGEIGRLVSERARGFGMRVVYTDRQRLDPALEEQLCVAWRDMPQLLQDSDVVSVHVPNTADNRRLIDRDAIGRMRKDAFLLNTSRGALVDEDALYDALIEGRLAGAGLDVHEREPRAPDRFCKLGNVVLTPHIAGGSRLAVLREIGAIFDNVRAALAGEPVPHARITG
jgi:phosphoglycerate dehydrogenase-like enzyme